MESVIGRPEMAAFGRAAIAGYNNAGLEDVVNKAIGSSGLIAANSSLAGASAGR
jgi:hypothetical protein